MASKQATHACCDARQSLRTHSAVVAVGSGLEPLQGLGAELELQQLASRVKLPLRAAALRPARAALQPLEPALQLRVAISALLAEELHRLPQGPSRERTASREHRGELRLQRRKRKQPVQVPRVLRHRR